jgi:hypothetical protein
MASLTRLEVSVQSLHGIDLTPIFSLQPDDEHKNKDQPGGSTPRNIHNSSKTPIICTVGFSGSSENMQIGSSRLCTETGRLVIESDPWGCSKQSMKRASSTSFRWTDPRPNPPHVTVFLDAPPTSRTKQSSQKNHSFTVPLTKINRGSKLVLRQTSRDSKRKISAVPSPMSSSSSPASSRRNQHGPDFDDGGESLIWGYPKSDESDDDDDDDDDEAASLPEILEISIRVNEQPVGVAFFVFFGQNNPDDPGTYVLDLPVRKPSHSSTKSSLPVLTDQTKLRIKVTVTAPPPSGGIQKNSTNKKQQRENDDEDDTIPNLSYCSTASSSYSSPNHHRQLLYTRSMLEDQVNPLMQKLRQHEREAMQFRQAQKSAMDVVVSNPNNHSSSSNNNSNSIVLDEPMGTNLDSSNNVNDLQRSPQPPQPPQPPFHNSSSAFCQGIVWNWSQIRQTLEAAVYCGGNGSAAAIRLPKFMGDDASLDGSTIATRESWDI